MRILRRLYHFLLFLTVSWTVYNTFLFICLLLPASDNKYVELYIFDFWNYYLLGALDYHKFSYQILGMLDDCLNPEILREFWPFLVYMFAVKVLVERHT